MYTFSFSGNTKETVSSDVKVLKKDPGDKRINVMNSTEIGKCTTIQELCCFESLEQPHRTIISTLNVFLSITALMGNVLIFVALQKVTSLRPPSKLLLGCLATTDLCGGLISQPLFVTFILAPQHSKLCYPSPPPSSSKDQ